jgi:hypothetical protein
MRGQMTDLEVVKMIDEKIIKAVGQSERVTSEQLKAIAATLGSVDGKVTKQNGNVAEAMKRVSLLEQARLTRPMDCPNLQTILNLKDWQQQNEMRTMTRDEFKKQNRASVVFASTVVGLLVTAINLMPKLVELIKEVLK